MVSLQLQFLTAPQTKYLISCLTLFLEKHKPKWTNKWILKINEISESKC